MSHVHGFADHLCEQLDNHLKRDRFGDKRNSFADLTCIRGFRESYKNKNTRGSFIGQSVDYKQRGFNSTNGKAPEV